MMQVVLFFFVWAGYKYNEQGIFHENRTPKCLRSQAELRVLELADHKLIEAPSNFIAGRPKAAPLFWLFGVFFFMWGFGIFYLSCLIGK